MIGKVISGKSFGGTVGYVMKKDANILDAKGIMPPEVKDMVQDFEDQSLLNPRVKNTVGHISLSFSEQDKAKLTDKFMADVAKEYMQKMSIDNTQYLIVRHNDAPHPHCHIVYNRVKNDGTTVPDSNIRIRNVKACKELTEKHGLYFATGKENVREHRLREPDKTKYEIYHAVKDGLKRAKNWQDLTSKLQREGISVEFKYKGNTGIKEGVKFSKNGYIFSGSKVDQAFSYSKLDKHFNQAQRTEQRPMSTRTNHYSPQSQKNLQSAISGYMAAFGKGFSSKSTDSINLTPMGGGNLPLPSMDLGIGISAAQMQRQPGETPEQHIARITALINSVTAAMIAHTEQQKRKQQKQVKKQYKISF